MAGWKGRAWVKRLAAGSEAWCSDGTPRRVTVWGMPVPDLCAGESPGDSRQETRFVPERAAGGDRAVAAILVPSLDVGTFRRWLQHPPWGLEGEDSTEQNGNTWGVGLIRQLLAVGSQGAFWKAEWV